jgi:hypothetical protein
MTIKLTEVFQLVHRQTISKQMEKDILQATRMSVTTVNASPEVMYERTNLSRLIQEVFLGLNFMNLLKRTWLTGAMPMGAPGWPEFAFAVISTARQRIVLMHFQSRSE